MLIGYDKMGGDLHEIITVGRYLIEVWNSKFHCSLIFRFGATGMDVDHVGFVWPSDEVNKANAKAGVHGLCEKREPSRVWHGFFWCE